MLIEAFASADSAMRAVLLVATVGVSVSTAEDLRRRDVFADGGVLSWPVLRVIQLPSTSPPVRKVLDRVYQPSAFAVLLWLKLAASLSLIAVLLVQPRLPAVPALAAVVLACLLLMNRRSVFGLDGSDHMNTVVFVGALLFFVTPAGSLAATAGVVYVVAQSLLAYLVSGVAKLLGPAWRNGHAVKGIVSTRLYGHEALGRFLAARPALTKATCWAVIAFECSFPVTLFVGGEYLVGMLAIGVMFHVTAAIFMGLNGFLPAFVSTYPAVVYLNHHL